MTETTKQIISAALSGDSSVADNVRESALRLLAGEIPIMNGTHNPPPRDEILTLTEAAQRLRCSERSIINYANAGKIRRVAPGGRRAIGYSALSIDALFS